MAQGAPADGRIRSEDEAPAVRRPWAQLITTATGQQILREDLECVRRELDTDFTERLRDARALGGAVSNAYYVKTMDQQEILAAALARIESLLASATIVDDAEPFNEAGSATEPVVRARPGRA